ncbi:MAG: putative Ig domain-containing protein [Acidobacteriia bacterium]|nr:putative Ig domain-containing protein [Terriglobia bacterium]
MNTRWLYFVIATVVAVLFTSNYFIVQGSTEVDCDKTLEDCECRVTVVNEATLRKSANPSCSVDDLFGGSLQTCSIVKVGVFIDDIVRCDRGVRAVLECGPKGIRQVVSAGSSIRLSCFSNSSTIKTTNSKGDWVDIGTSKNTSVFKSAWNRLARFAGAEDETRHTMVTETERVTIINGDGGFLTDNRNPVVMLTAGEAVVESFCDGSITRLKAPAIVNLTRFVGNIDPTTSLPMNLKFQACVADEMTGRWYGLYHRAYDGKNENVPVTIDLRQEPFTLETPDGVFSVNPFTISSSRVSLEAVARTGKGTLKLDGTFDKGVLNFRYSEESVSGPEDITRYGSGSAQRLYIAQWAVAPAAVDTPYNHPLLALTPATGDLTWSIVSGKLPAGIALDGLTGVLSGTPAAEGTSDFTVEVRDANGNSYKQSLTLNVNKLVVNTLFLPQAIPNQEYRFKIEVSGGAPPYTFNDLLLFPFPIPGLPPMAKISPEGEITFTPAFMSGSTQFEVVDSKGLKQDVFLVIQTRKLLIQGSAFLPSASAGQPFSFVFEAAGQQGPVKWEADPQSLEQTGLSLNTQTGELSGTPMEKGVYSFSIMASDDSSSMTRQFTLTVGTSN